MLGGVIGSPKSLVKTVGSMESYITVSSSVVDEVWTTANRFSKWTNNLPTNYQLASGIEIARYRWTAKAKYDETGSQQKARLGIDGSLSTNWNTEAVQTPGQWYQVSFYRDETFNTIILNAPNNQGPAQFKVEVSSDGNSWRQVSEGQDASSMAIITFNTVTAKHVRITQLGSKSVNWGISEFKIALLKDSQLTGISSLEMQDEEVEYRHQTLFFNQNTVGSDVAVYDTAGGCVFSSNSAPAIIRLNQLPKGIYVVLIKYPRSLKVKRMKLTI